MAEQRLGEEAVSVADERVPEASALADERVPEGRARLGEEAV